MGDYLHVRNLEKYHPGYKDRDLRWAKIMFNMVQGDPDCEMIENEIDWGRFIKIILLELQAQKPLPIDDRYFEKKGFDVKKRPIQLTLDVLHNFIEVVTQDEKLCGLEGDKKENKKESRGDTVTEDFKGFEETTILSWNSFCDEQPNISKVLAVSEKRRFKLKRLFRTSTFKDLLSIITAIKEQPFLLGDNDRKWVVSFDWLIENDTNHLKVLERKYKNAEPRSDLPESLRYLAKK